MLKFSLIVPSINRVDELVRLFESLDRQTARDFEVILVDQNPDGRLLPIAEDFGQRFLLKHVRSETRGAGRARNIGMAQAQGKFLLWPDDDSWYPPTLLEDIDRLFIDNPNISGIIGILIDEKRVSYNRWKPSKAAQATYMDAFIHAAESSIFLQREVVTKVGGFDDAIGTGAGTLWGAGESTDLCVRLMKAKAQLLVVPSIQIFHPNPPIHPGDIPQRQKAFNYARGMGAVLKKNRLNPFFVIRYIFTYLRALLWNGLQFKWDQTRYHWVRLKGVVEGWVKYPGSNP